MPPPFLSPHALPLAHPRLSLLLRHSPSPLPRAAQQRKDHRHEIVARQSLRHQRPSPAGPPHRPITAPLHCRIPAQDSTPCLTPAILRQRDCASSLSYSRSLLLHWSTLRPSSTTMLCLLAPAIALPSRPPRMAVFHPLLRSPTSKPMFHASASPIS